MSMKLPYMHDSPASVHNILFERTCYYAPENQELILCPSTEHTYILLPFYLVSLT